MVTMKFRDGVDTLGVVVPVTFIKPDRTTPGVALSCRGGIGVGVDPDGYTREEADPIGIGIKAVEPLGAMLTLDQAKAFRDLLSRAIDIVEAETIRRKGAPS